MPNGKDDTQLTADQKAEADSASAFKHNWHDFEKKERASEKLEKEQLALEAKKTWKDLKLDTSRTMQKESTFVARNIAQIAKYEDDNGIAPSDIKGTKIEDKNKAVVPKPGENGGGTHHSVVNHRTANVSRDFESARNADSAAQAEFNAALKKDPAKAFEQITAAFEKANKPSSDTHDPQHMKDVKALQNMLKGAGQDIGKFGDNGVDGVMDLKTDISQTRQAFEKLSYDPKSPFAGVKADRLPGEVIRGRGDIDLSGQKNQIIQNPSEQAVTVKVIPAVLNTTTTPDSTPAKVAVKPDVPEVKSFYNDQEKKIDKDAAEKYGRELAADPDRMKALMAAGKFEKLANSTGNHLDSMFLPSDNGQTGYRFKMDATGAIHFDKAYDLVNHFDKFQNDMNKAQKEENRHLNQQDRSENRSNVQEGTPAGYPPSGVNGYVQVALRRGSHAPWEPPGGQTLALTKNFNPCARGVPLAERAPPRHQRGVGVGVSLIFGS